MFFVVKENLILVVKGNLVLVKEDFLAEDFFSFEGGCPLCKKSLIFVGKFIKSGREFFLYYCNYCFVYVIF
jgi:hypothetical protein